MKMMSKRTTLALAGILTLVMMAVVGSGCSQDSQSEPAPARIGKQQEHEQRKADLVLQFSDDFSQNYGPPDYFDLTRWTRVKTARARTEDGYWLLEVGGPPPLGPGDIDFGGFGTTERSFNPGLAGTNGVEITVADLSHERDLPEEPEKPGELSLVHAWSLTVGNWRGLVGEQGEKDRGVQLHFDLLRPDGLFVYLVRGILPEDFDKYPMDGFGRRASPGGRTRDLSPREQRELHEKEIEHGGIFISVPTLILACRVYRTEQEINEILGHSRRWGLYLTDDANTVYWTLDGQVMDSVDIAGYFSSSPESVQDGALLTVMGVASFQLNTWRMDDLEILVSPL